ncbi:MAG: DUF2029 domain-containing protein [Candidatus Bathyarchaeota archaeon]|nr:DUF2029 domain-containing protein [Candidatus Bathyarchaeota archaeon]
MVEFIMAGYSRLGKRLFVVGVAVLLALNVYTFFVAYPETYTLTPGINTSGSVLAKDFSAYYVSAWRLWNNPAQIYTVGAIGGGEPYIQPHPQTYKYLPSFSLMLSPLLLLDYQQALIVFDVFQFLLLPIMAFLLYHLLEKKGLVATFVVTIIALLLPSPAPNKGFSVIYYWQWGEGQAKVLITFLLLLSFYFGSRGKPYLSGIALALGFFDPRFGLLALPLFVMYNRRSLKAAALSAVVTLVVSNLMLLYPGLALGFFGMVWASGVTTPLYYYAFIPFFTLISLMVINYRELAEALDFRAPKRKF